MATKKPKSKQAPKCQCPANHNLWQAGNADVSSPMSPFYSLEMRKERIATAFREVFNALGIDYENDPNMAGTPERVAKMYVDEIFGGRFRKAPAATAFPNTKQVDQMMVVGPMKVKSMCSHHLMPIYGKAWVGILPKVDGKVLGLSKFPRYVDWVARRPQIQEELTHQIADAVEKMVEARGVAVYIEAMHMCTSHRGIQDENTVMKTSELRGVFRSTPAIKDELFSIIRGSGVAL